MQINWEGQKHSNVYAFVHDRYFEERMKALREICQLFSEEEIRWTLSCSSSLFFRGMIDDFNDYDILVDARDAEKLLKTLVKHGATLEKDDTQKGGYFASPFYREGFFKGIHLDLIANITVCTYGTRYCYEFQEEELEWVQIEDFRVPICPVEASLVLYGMMEGWQGRRRYKRELCREYLEENGVKYPEILEEGLNQRLPLILEAVVNKLLEK